MFALYLIHAKMEYKHLPDLNGFATLRAVIERGGVVEAAKLLCIGQPAVSKRLRGLESCYGVKLLEKTSGRLQLTEAGEKVYALAVQTLERHRLLYDELQFLSKGGKQLRLEVTFAIGEHFLPNLLMCFANAHPDYTINSRLAYSRQIQTNLATGLTDLALMESAPDHPDILVQKWREDELVLVCGAQHTLANTEYLPIDRLNEFEYVLRETRASIRESLDEALKRVSIGSLPTAMEVGSNYAIIDILTHGRYASFLPRFAVNEELQMGRLHRIKVNGFRILRTLWIARHRRHLSHPVAEAFIGVLRNQK